MKRPDVLVILFVSSALLSAPVAQAAVPGNAGEMLPAAATKAARVAPAIDVTPRPTAPAPVPGPYSAPTPRSLQVPRRAGLAGPSDAGEWQQASPASAPSLRQAMGVVYDSYRNVIVAVGGSDSNGPLDETWEYDGSTWTQRVTAHSPGGRNRPAIAYDSIRHAVVLFGGSSPGDQVFYNDTWEYNGQDWVQRSPSNPPPMRNGAGMAFDPVRDVMVLFGGYCYPCGYAFYGDTWEYDGNQWTQGQPADEPQARETAGLAYDTNRKVMVLFGGGTDAGSTVYADTWEWDGSDWTQRAPAASPSPRWAATMVYDQDRDRVVVFSGLADLSDEYQDTWEYDGSTWAQIGGSQSPSRWDAGMAYDAAFAQTVLFGGASYVSGLHLLNDTWTYVAATYSVSGRVTDAGSNPLSGVTVSAGAGGSAVTQSDGTYVLSGLTAGTYTLTPSISGYSFMEPSASVTVPPARPDQDFLGTPQAVAPQPGACAIPFYWQRDTTQTWVDDITQKTFTWNDFPLHTTPDLNSSLHCSQETCATIGQCGCALTSAAMLFAGWGATVNGIAVNPPILDNSMGQYACLFYWTKSASQSDGMASYVTDYRFAYPTLDQLMDGYHEVIVGMCQHGYCDPNKSPFYPHFVLVVAVSGQGDSPADYSIYDPWYENGNKGHTLLSRTSPTGPNNTYWDLTDIRVYDEQGQPMCAASARHGPRVPGSGAVQAFSRGSGPRASDIVSGTAMIYDATSVTMTVWASAESEPGDVTQMQIATSAISETQTATDTLAAAAWQPYQSLAVLPVADVVYVDFRDQFGNTSGVYSDTNGPVSGPVSLPLLSTFLPILLRGPD